MESIPIITRSSHAFLDCNIALLRFSSANKFVKNLHFESGLRTDHLIIGFFFWGGGGLLFDLGPSFFFIFSCPQPTLDFFFTVSESQDIFFGRKQKPVF